MATTFLINETHMRSRFYFEEISALFKSSNWNCLSLNMLNAHNYLNIFVILILSTGRRGLLSMLKS